MPRVVRVAACQVPDVREDIEASLSILKINARQAEDGNVDLLLFPEGFLQGYLTEEEQVCRYALELNSPAFEAILHRLATVKPMLVFGLIEAAQAKFYNSAVVIHRGRLLGVYRKRHLLPGESVFQAGASYPIFESNGLKFGINVCYDMQFAEAAAGVASQGAQVILCAANNMMRRENAQKWKYRHHEMRCERAKETGLWIVSADVTGERDGRIGYGPTSVINPQGKVADQVPLLEVGMVVVDIAL